MLTFGGNGEGNLTAVAGTAIEAVLPANREGVTRLIKLTYANGATAHLLRAQRELGRTTAATLAASGQAVINLTADPGPSGNALAANDRLIIQHSDGTQRLYTVQSITGLAVTLTASLAAAVAAGGLVWNMGVVADTDPITGRAHPQFPLAGSATTVYEDREVGIVAGHKRNSPVLLSVNNITNAGTIAQLTYGHTIN